MAPSWAHNCPPRSCSRASGGPPGTGATRRTETDRRDLGAACLAPRPGRCLTSGPPIWQSFRPRIEQPAPSVQYHSGLTQRYTRVQPSALLCVIGTPLGIGDRDGGGEVSRQMSRRGTPFKPVSRKPCQGTETPTHPGMLGRDLTNPPQPGRSHERRHKASTLLAQVPVRAVPQTSALHPDRKRRGIVGSSETSFQCACEARGRVSYPILRLRHADPSRRN